jgi:hypothetical protein
VTNQTIRTHLILRLDLDLEECICDCARFHYSCHSLLLSNSGSLDIPGCKKLRVPKNI